MKVYDAASIRNVALVGHSGSGKTQLASAILADAAMINRFGKVDEGTTVTDFDEEEIARKHTLSASLAYAEWNKQKINPIDTPAGPRRAQQAMTPEERAKALFAEGLVNRTDYEKAQDDVSLTDIELRSAREAEAMEVETLDLDLRNRHLSVDRQRSATEELRRQVAELVVKAPFDGMVATVTVQDRDAVARNQPLFMVVNLGSFEVEFELPENYASDVTPGTRAEVMYEGRNWPGRVTAVSPEVKDSQVKGTLVFDGETPQNLRQSQRVSTRLILDRRTNVLKLPRGPFLESGGGRLAYVVVNGVAQQKPVEVGAVSVSEVEVVRGVSEGDEVVLSDTSVFEGAKSVLVRR